MTSINPNLKLAGASIPQVKAKKAEEKPEEKPMLPIDLEKEKENSEKRVDLSLDPRAQAGQLKAKEALEFLKDKKPGSFGETILTTTVTTPDGDVWITVATVTLPLIKMTHYVTEYIDPNVLTITIEDNNK